MLCNAHDVAQVPLTNGGFALVDASDLPLVSGHTWRRSEQGYAQAGVTINGKQRQVRMHQLIVKTDSPEIDHRNRDKLNNTRSNLRPCTNQQNQANREALPHSSKYKGVSYRPKLRKWVANIGFNCKIVYLGIFASEEAAARAYDDAAVRLFGEFAKTNF